MKLDEAAWAEVRRLYCQDGLSYGVLAARFAISATTISARSRREGWRKASAPRRRGKQRLSSRPPSATAHRSLMTRLYRAISRKLEHMEARMASGEDRSAQDEERESRALGTMIRNFEKVTEVVSDLDRARTPDAGGAAAARADAERMRQTIAERLERLTRERDADSGSGAA